jgi:hypothetical protein
MAIDISTIVTANPIKNGTIVVQACGGHYGSGVIKLDTYVLNTPTSGNIGSKYTNRFNDPAYYYGVTSVNGGGA